MMRRMIGNLIQWFLSAADGGRVDVLLDKKMNDRYGLKPRPERW